MKRSKVMLLSFLAVLFVLISPLSVFGAEEPFSLKVFHTNDMHASIDDFGKMAAFLEAERAKVDHSLYLDAGDVSSGNPVVDLQSGAPIFTLLNAMELDAMTIGNHEFDYGQEAFQSNKTLSNFPWLSANMTITDPSIPIDGVEPYHIFEFDGIKVGVLGLTEAPPATSPSGIVGLNFNAYLDTVTQYASLREEVDVLIGLNHVGIADDRRIAEATDFFDVIIGGHSHTQLDTPEIVNGTAIVQSGSNARNIGMLTITLDEVTGEVTVEGALQPVEALDDEVVDTEVQALVDGFNDASEELLSEVLGQTNTGLSREDRWLGDVQLGNMITDALRNFANTDIAITNNGGIRASIEPGDITAGDVFTVDPFGNVVTIVEMTGRDLKEVIAYSYHRSLEDYGPQIDLQTSGLTYTIYTDEDGLYADSELFVGGEPIDLDSTYSIATNNFIIEGGDGYDFSAATMVQEDAGLVTSALIQYIQETTETEGAVDYNMTDDRIQVQAQEETAPVEPEQPTEPETPVTPNEPEQPVEEETPAEDTNDAVEDEETTSEDQAVEETVEEGERLPDTATPIVNLLMVGMVLMGGSIFVLKKKAA